MRYFFDIHDGLEVTDRNEVELPDLQAARLYALRMASEYAGRPDMLGADGGAIVVDVREAAGTPVLTVRLAFGVEVPAQA